MRHRRAPCLPEGHLEPISVDVMIHPSPSAFALDSVSWSPGRHSSRHAGALSLIQATLSPNVRVVMLSQLLRTSGTRATKKAEQSIQRLERTSKVGAINEQVSVMRRDMCWRNYSATMQTLRLNVLACAPSNIHSLCHRLHNFTNLRMEYDAIPLSIPSIFCDGFGAFSAALLSKTSTLCLSPHTPHYYTV